jgi:hypothetical protein
MMDTTRNQPERQRVTNQEAGQRTPRDQHRVDRTDAWSRHVNSGGGR